MSSEGPRDGGYELHNRLLRHSHRVLEDSSAEYVSGDLLFFGKPVIESVDQNVCINESGHGRKGPLLSTLDRLTAVSWALVVCGGVPLLGRISEPALPHPQQGFAYGPELRESYRPPESIRFHRLAGYCTVPR